MTLPHTQPQRPVSGFAITTLVPGIMGIVLPAVICGIVALGQIRGGSYSGRGMVIAGLLIGAAWVLLVAAFAAYVVIAWPGQGPATSLLISSPHDPAPAVWPAAIRTVRPARPPVSAAPAHPSTPASPRAAAMGVKPGQNSRPRSSSPGSSSGHMWSP